MATDEELLAAQYINIQIGSADRLSPTDLLMASAKVLDVLQKVSPLTAISISIGGYDHDERAICEIPEACDYILGFISILEAADIPPSRFIDDTYELFKSCLAVEAGKKVIFTGERKLGDPSQVTEYRERVKGTLN